MVLSIFSPAVLIVSLYMIIPPNVQSAFTLFFCIYCIVSSANVQANFFRFGKSEHGWRMKGAFFVRKCACGSARICVRVRFTLSELRAVSALPLRAPDTGNPTPVLQLDSPHEIDKRSAEIRLIRRSDQRTGQHSPNRCRRAGHRGARGFPARRTYIRFRRFCCARHGRLWRLRG